MKPVFQNPPALALSVVAAACLAGGGAHATTLLAQGGYSLNANPVTTLAPATTLPYADVIAFPSSAPSSAVLHSYGSTTGNFGSRSSGDGVYAVTGSFRITEVITNSSATAMAAVMNFNITPGLLMNTINSPLTGAEFVQSSVNFDIKVGGSSVWGSAASLVSNASATGTFSTSGANLYTLQSPTYYSINGGAYSVGLGTIAPGASILMSYTLSTAASGNSLGGTGVFVPAQTVTVPPQWMCKDHNGAAGLPAGCMGNFVPGSVITIPAHFQPGTPSGSHASSGDPFSIDGTTGDAVFSSNGSFDPVGLSFELSPVPVPEPGTVALMLSGFGLLAWRLRRRV